MFFNQYVHSRTVKCIPIDRFAIYRVPEKSTANPHLTELSNQKIFKTGTGYQKFELYTTLKKKGIVYKNTISYFA